jgi:hemerythrin-like domain-containing protein
MLFLDSLRRDHDAIEVVAQAFSTFALDPPGDPAASADGEAFVRFFRLYAGRFHHGREERVLFPALVRETEAAADRGPIPALVGHHREMEGLLDELALALALGASGGLEPARVAELGARYVSLLLRHIDAENSVLLPESEARFRRVSLLTLEDREPDDEERAARDAGLLLVRRYPPTSLPGLLRGDGCVCCPSFGVSCDGVEREWSSDLEREDMADRVG